MVEEPSFICRSFTLIMSALKIWKQIRLHLRNVIYFLSNLNVNVVDSDKSNSTFNTYFQFQIKITIQKHRRHPHLYQLPWMRRKIIQACPTTTHWCPNGLLCHYCLKEVYFLPTMFRQQIPTCQKIMPQKLFFWLHHSIGFGTASYRIDGIVVSRSWRHILCLSSSWTWTCLYTPRNLTPVLGVCRSSSPSRPLRLVVDSKAGVCWVFYAR